MEQNTVFLGDLKDGTVFITEYTKIKATLVYKSISAAYVEWKEPTTITVKNKDGYEEEKVILVRKRVPWSLKTVVIPLKPPRRSRGQKGKEKKSLN